MHARAALVQMISDGKESGDSWYGRMNARCTHTCTW